MMIFLRGLGMGVAVGLSPGPVLALIRTQSFQFGIHSGVWVAAATALATLPVVLIALSFRLILQNAHGVQGALAVGGILFLLYLAYDALSLPTIQMQAAAQPVFSFAKGFLATCLFPVAYLFWISVGIPVSSAGQAGFSATVLSIFEGGFTLTLFTVNASVAAIVSRYGKVLPLGLIHILFRSTALIFLGFAGALARQLILAR